MCIRDRGDPVPSGGFLGRRDGATAQSASPGREGPPEATRSPSPADRATLPRGRAGFLDPVRGGWPPDRCVAPPPLAATELIQHAFGGKRNPYLSEPTLVFGERAREKGGCAH